jgi:transcriptional regulator with PAS, ATPase and Fis domain
MGDYVAEVTRLTKRQTNTVAFDDLVGTSGPMQLVKRMGERGAKSGAPILILGESGVGKELIARAIQGASDAPASPSWP